MKMSKLLKTSALAALAASLTVTALPAHAADKERGWRSESKSDRGSSRSQRATVRSERSDRSSSQRPQRVERPAQVQRPVRMERPSAQVQRPVRVERPTPQQARPAAGDVRAARIDRGAQIRAQQERTEQSRDWNRSGRPSTYDRATVSRDDRNRSYRDNDRNTSYRDGDRNRTYGDRDGRNWSDRDRDGRNWSGRDRDGRNWDRDRNYRDSRYRDNHRNWDRRWRDNHRYDWYRYRTTNRSVFHIGRYYSPYRSYSYRRLSIGFNLDSLFYGNRYWINDPWQYRLPAVYGPYRWVRYYDDVLLVDTYSGEVVDVIYDFFW